MLSSSMIHTIRLVEKSVPTPPPVQHRYCHHTHFVRVPGQYLLLNLSAPAQMDACGLKASIVTRAGVID